MTAQTCGTCRHGVATEFGMIQCQLGWEVHDGLPKSYGGKGKDKVVTHMPHGELELPEATPDCRCGCLPNKWLPKHAPALVTEAGA